jgi:enoyl-CoA hydratase/carnithine racemase
MRVTSIGPSMIVYGRGGRDVEGGASRDIETGSEQLLGRLEDRVAVLTLNRPEARNALTWELKAALVETVPRLGADPDVGCLLLTGAGSAFCAGGDTKNMAREGRPPSAEERMRILRWEHSLPAAIHRLEKPVVAALPGPAAGAGLSLALSCDLRIAAESAFVTTSYARLGLSGDYGGSWFLTALVGTARARELYFTGERVNAAECERLGIVNRVVPDADLEKESLALAKRIAAGPPIALRYMKDNLNRALCQGLQACLDVEAERMVQSAQTEDYLEAVKAFGEKRSPVFRGR